LLSILCDPWKYSSCIPERNDCPASKLEIEPILCGAVRYCTTHLNQKWKREDSSRTQNQRSWFKCKWSWLKCTGSRDHDSSERDDDSSVRTGGRSWHHDSSVSIEWGDPNWNASTGGRSWHHDSSMSIERGDHNWSASTGGRSWHHDSSVSIEQGDHNSNVSIDDCWGWCKFWLNCDSLLQFCSTFPWSWKRRKAKNTTKKTETYVCRQQNVQMNMKLSCHHKRGADLQAFLFG
jgi:hypothetical protein